jgi:hypothetical protein
MIVKLERLAKGNLCDKPTKTKTCCDCKQDKQLKEFKKNCKMKDGRLKRCNVCEKKRLAMKVDGPEYAKQFFTHDKFYI